MSHLRNRTKVYCFCKKCNGCLVDPRTKKNHTSAYNINSQGAGSSAIKPHEEVNDDEDMDLNIYQEDDTFGDYDEIEHDLLPEPSSEPSSEPLPEPLPEPLSERIFLTKKLSI